MQDICNELQQHCNPVAVTLENCVQAKECIVHYFEHIRQQVKEGNELFKEQKSQLRNREENLRQQGWSLCSPYQYCKKSEILIAVSIFFDVILCSLVGCYQCFKESDTFIPLLSWRYRQQVFPEVGNDLPQTLHGSNFQMTATVCMDLRPTWEASSCTATQ